jgi:hypothetical protein
VVIVAAKLPEETQMKEIRVAAFVGDGVQSTVLSLQDVDVIVMAIDADFDGEGVPKDRPSRTIRTAGLIKELRNSGSASGGFDRVAYSLAYTYKKRHSDLEAKYGLVAILITDMYIYNMHVVGCDTEAEYLAFIASMQLTVSEVFSPAMPDRAPHGRAPGTLPLAAVMVRAAP